MKKYKTSSWSQITTAANAKKAFATLLLMVLWLLNGYAQDPWLIKDINPTGAKNGPVGGAASIAGISQGAKTMYSANGLAFFTADDGLHGVEMWRTDGTAAGTSLLLDITPGAGSTTFGDVYEAGSLLYFKTNNGGNITLWRTDGTSAGTYSIMSNSGVHSISNSGDVNDGSANRSTILGNYYYFTVTDNLGTITYNGFDYQNTRFRIYKTDGTVAGTSIYYDAGMDFQNDNGLHAGFSNGLVFGSIRGVIAVSNKIYVVGVNNVPYHYDSVADTDNYNAESEWGLSSGGENSAPAAIYTPKDGINLSQMVNVNNNYLLIAASINNSSGNLYRLKPTETTPVLLDGTGNSTLLAGAENIYTSNDFTTGSLCFYRNGNNGKSVTNGEVAGTFALSGMANTSAVYTGIVNNKMTFVNDDAKLYSWDGLSPTSYQVVSDSLTGKSIDRVVQAGSKVFYFNQQFRPLQVSDLSGNNCFSVYPGYFGDRGFLLNNNYIDFGQGHDGSFDAGFEPHLINTSFKIFTGAISNNWNAAGNWLPNGVPAATDDVVIPQLTATRYPVISGNANCRNITMYQSRLTINTGAILNVNGYLAKYKAQIQGVGTVTLKGPNTTIYGSYAGLFGSNQPDNLFDAANVNITGTDVSFATPNATINSAVNFKTANKIVAPYTTLNFNKKPFITGYGNNSYIITGNGNSVNFNRTGSSTTTDSLFTIPVGTTASSYTPVSFTYKYDDGAGFGVSLADSINRGGTTGGARVTSAAVNKTWTISASGGSPLNNVGIALKWNNTADELTGFKRNFCFISNFTGSKWSTGTLGAAVFSNSLYAVKQTYPAGSLNGAFIVSSDVNLSPGLSALAVSPGPLSPVFSTATNTYTASVANNVSSIKITPTAIHTTDTIKVNGVTVLSGGFTNVPLVVGQNGITIIVTAQDGITTQSYSLTVFRAFPANANITLVKLSSGTLSPAFAQLTTSYTASVANTISSITVTPTTSDVNATVTVNGTAVVSKTASAAIPLVVGPNTIEVIGIAQNGATKTYTIVVTRAPSSNATLSALHLSTGTLSPAFTAATTGYTASVITSVSSVTVTPTTGDPNAMLTVNGATVTSGTASASIPLSIGPNTITTVVTAQDGTTITTYTVTVTRAASANANILQVKLSSGTLSPNFAQATTTYTASVTNAISSITATPVTSDANATVKVNGTLVKSGTASGAITLNVGSNTITAIATAQDGSTTKTYTITVTRAIAGANSLYEPISVVNPANSPQIADNITVRQGVSPNGDGVNDVLVIDGITAYPDNKLSIMARNGELVFEANGYNNSSKVFDGHSNKNGKMQSPGTYFYLLDYKVKGVTKHKTGFIILKY